MFQPKVFHRYPMDKQTLISNAITAIFGYYAVTGERLPHLKTFVARCCFVALVCSHSYSFYLLATNPAELNLIRALTLTVAAIGFIVLAAAGWFLEAHRRGYFAQR